jgi:DNA repair protein RadD
MTPETLMLGSMRTAAPQRPTRALRHRGGEGWRAQGGRVGRALRTEPGKEMALIFDHAGNLWRHGLCDEPRQWSLRSKRRRSVGAALVKEFPDCHSMVEIETGTCPEYGFVFAEGLQRRNPVVIAGVLDQVTIADRLRAVRWAGADPDRLSWVAKARGYRLVWIWHRLREQARTEP